MCNYVHYPKDHEELKSTSGIGYKLVKSPWGDEIYPVCGYIPFLKGSDKYIHWGDTDEVVLGDGFCFFFTKFEAERAKSIWEERTEDKLILKTISYRGALCKQQETKFVLGKSFTVGICKSFKFLD